MSFRRPWVCMVPACAMRVLSMRLMESIRAGKGRLLGVSSCSSCADFMWGISYKTKQARRADFASAIMASSLLRVAEPSSWADDCIVNSVWSGLGWAGCRRRRNALNKLAMAFPDGGAVSKNWSAADAEWLSEGNGSLTEFRVSGLEDCCRCGNQAKANKKGKPKAGIGIPLYVSCYNAAQTSDVDHPVWSSIGKSPARQAREKTYQ